VRVSMVVPDGAAPGTKLTYVAPDGQELRLTVPEGVPPGSVMTLTQDPSTKQWKCMAEPAEPPGGAGEIPPQAAAPAQPQMHSALGGCQQPVTERVTTYVTGQPPIVTTYSSIGGGAPTVRSMPTQVPAGQVHGAQLPGAQMLPPLGQPMPVNLSYVPPPVAGVNSVAMAPGQVILPAGAPLGAPVPGAVMENRPSYTPPPVAVMENRPSYTPLPQGAAPMVMPTVLGAQGPSYVPPPVSVMQNPPSYVPPPAPGVAMVGTMPAGMTQGGPSITTIPSQVAHGQPGAPVPPPHMVPVGGLPPPPHIQLGGVGVPMQPIQMQPPGVPGLQPPMPGQPMGMMMGPPIGVPMGAHAMGPPLGGVAMMGGCLQPGAPMPGMMPGMSLMGMPPQMPGAAPAGFPQPGMMGAPQMPGMPGVAPQHSMPGMQPPPQQPCPPGAQGSTQPQQQ